MGGHLKRRVAGVAIAGVVIAGVVAVTSMSASGQTPQPAGGVVTALYGTLTINLNSSGGSYVLDRTEGADRTDAIAAAQPCATVAPGSGALMVLVPTTDADTVQIRNNAFGVNTNNTSCGSSQAAVISGSERLTLTLGPDLANVYIKSADLKATRVKRGDLQYALDGGDLSGGVAIPQNPTLVNVDPLIATADDLFRSITIASTSTRDGEGVSIATGTTFELVTLDPNFDVAVNCGEFVTDASTFTGDVATDATYLRLDNKAGTNACQEVGVRVEIQPAVDGTGARESRVFWNNASQGVNGGSTQSVQAYFTIVWTATNDLTKLDRDIDYDGDGLGQTVAVKVQWCGPDDPTIPGNLPTLPGSTPGIGINVGAESPDWRAPWCLVEDERILQADGKIVQTQKLFGSGDPWAR